MKELLLPIFVALTSASIAQAQTTDPHIAQAEKLFGYVLHNQPDSLYQHLSDKVKGMVQPAQLKDILKQTETQCGKYLSHGTWKTQDVMGQKAYCAPVKFEKGELAVFVFFDEKGKSLGIRLLPALQK